MMKRPKTNFKYTIIKLGMSLFLKVREAFNHIVIIPTCMCSNVNGHLFPVDKLIPADDFPSIPHL